MVTSMTVVETSWVRQEFFSPVGATEVTVSGLLWNSVNDVGHDSAGLWSESMWFGEKTACLACSASNWTRWTGTRTGLNATGGLRLTVKLRQVSHVSGVATGNQARFDNMSMVFSCPVVTTAPTAPPTMSPTPIPSPSPTENPISSEPTKFPTSSPTTNPTTMNPTDVDETFSPTASTAAAATSTLTPTASPTCSSRCRNSRGPKGYSRCEAGAVYRLDPSTCICRCVDLSPTATPTLPGSPTAAPATPVVFTVAGGPQTSDTAIRAATDAADTKLVLMLVFDGDFTTTDLGGVATAVGTELGQLRESIETMTLLEGSVVVLIVFAPGTLMETPTQFQIIVGNATWAATDVRMCTPTDDTDCSLSAGTDESAAGASSDSASSASAGTAVGVTIAVLLVLGIAAFVVIHRRRANSRDKAPTLPAYAAPTPVVENPALTDSLELVPMREPAAADNSPAAADNSYEAVNGKVPTGPAVDANDLAQQVSGSIANVVDSQHSFHNVAREPSVKVEPIDYSEGPAAPARAAPATAPASATAADYREPADQPADEGKWAGSVDSNIFVRDASGLSVRLKSVRHSADGNVVESDGGTLAEETEAI